MPTTSNGPVELFYETFGNPGGPTLLLVNGLGSQCINFKPEFCEKFVAQGFHVVRFDNRDVGLSSKLVDGPDYTLAEMADDGFAVLDAVGSERAHIAGWSMGGMIVQQMAIARPERVASLTSVMSSPGGAAVKLDDDVTAQFNAKPARSRDEAIAQHVANIGTWGSPAYQEIDRLSADAAAAYDRCFDPQGKARQVAAIFRSASRQDGLRALHVPSLVIHGDKDRLVPIELGRLTAECIPGARFEVIAGMGHDYPPQLWDTIVELISKHALNA